MTHAGDPLARYRTRLRRERAVYFGVVTAVVVALVVIVAVVYSRGEAAHASLHSITTAPPAIDPAAPATAPARSWSTTDVAAQGDPVAFGTVVTHDTHTVRGRDARTGRQTWAYTRTDRTVCAAVQAAGITFAFYEVNGNCDEVTGLSSGIGTRMWTRTLDQNGQPLNGRPTFAVLDRSTVATVLVISPSVIYAIDPATGYNRWTFGHYGCRIQHAVLGASGVSSYALISQTCTDPQCDGRQFCGKGPQLLLRDGTAAIPNDANDKNPDRIDWNLIGNRDQPVSADQVVAGVDTGSGRIDTFDLTKGTGLHSIRLPGVSAASTVSAAALGGPELVRVGGVTALLRPGSSRAAWTRTTLGAATVTATGDATVDTARITVPTATGAAVLAGDTGAVTTTIRFSPAPPGGSRVYPLGSGQLVVGPAGTTGYR